MNSSIHTANRQQARIAILVFAAFAMLTGIAQAQSPSVKELKEQFNTRLYVRHPDDPYSPFLAGAASYLIPGLGQMVCGETQRGLLFAGGVVGSGFVAFGGFAMAVNSNLPARRGYGVAVGVAGVMGIYGLYIYSIVDAVKLAKLKNMYYQRRMDKSVQLSVSPDLVPIPGKTGAAPGLTLRIGMW